jgi:hypothetical protein
MKKPSVEETPRRCSLAEGFDKSFGALEGALELGAQRLERCWAREG